MVDQQIDRENLEAVAANGFTDHDDAQIEEIAALTVTERVANVNQAEVLVEAEKQACVLAWPRGKNFGTVGTNIQLRCNLFEADVGLRAVHLCLYDVQITHDAYPDGLTVKQAKQILSQVMKSRREHIKQSFQPEKMAYDGRARILALGRIFKADLFDFSEASSTLRLKLQPGIIRLQCKLITDKKEFRAHDCFSHNLLKRDNFALDALNTVLHEKHTSTDPTEPEYEPCGTCGHQFFPVQAANQDKNIVVAQVGGPMLKVHKGYSSQFRIVGDAPNNARICLQLDVVHKAVDAGQAKGTAAESHQNAQAVGHFNNDVLDKPAHEHLDDIVEMFHQEELAADSHLQQFSVTFHLKGTHPKEVNGRVLPPPMQKFAALTARVKDGAWALPRDENDAEDRFVFPADGEIRWAAITISLFKETNELLEHACFASPGQFSNALVTFAKRRGLQFASEAIASYSVTASLINPKEPRANLSKCLLASSSAGAHMILLVAEDPTGINSDLVEFVRTVCETQLALRLQLVDINDVRTFGKEACEQNKLVLAPIVMQINAKFGGYASMLVLPECLKQRLPKPMMVIGLDRLDPADRDADYPSVVAMVASMSHVDEQFWVRTIVQNAGRPSIDLSSLMLDQLSTYRERNGILPGFIVLFRRCSFNDDAEIPLIITDELPQLRTACLEAGIEPVHMPKFVIIGVRYHSDNLRLFCKSPTEEVGKALNCPSGTVVDIGIVSPHDLDFYLVSELVSKGTSVPTYYRVLWNEGDDQESSADWLQHFAFALCHTDSGTSKTTSVPVPLHYAGVVCKRTLSYLKIKGSVERLLTSARIERDPSGHPKFSADQLCQLSLTSLVSPRLNGTNYFV